MLSAVHDFIIEQGQIWTRNIAWRDSAGSPLALASGYTANFTIKHYFGDPSSAIKTLTQAAGITLSSGAWNIVLNMTAAETAALDFLRAVYVLEVTLTSTTATKRILEGTIMLAKE